MGDSDTETIVLESHHCSVSEYAMFPIVHTHFCYKFQCQNSSEYYLIRPCQNPVGMEIYVVRIPRIPHPPSQVYHIDIQ